jgi:hypothetical protein
MYEIETFRLELTSCRQVLDNPILIDNTGQDTSYDAV